MASLEVSGSKYGKCGGKNPLHGKIPRIRVLHDACCESKSLYPSLYPLIGTNKIKYLLKTGVG